MTLTLDELAKTKTLDELAGTVPQKKNKTRRETIPDNVGYFKP